VLRKLVNRLATAVGTGTTRRFDRLLCGFPLDVGREDRSPLGGYYRAVLLRKRCPAGRRTGASE
jgi:hypothetical protein